MLRIGCLTMWMAAAGCLQALEFARPFGSAMVLPMGRDVAVWGAGASGDGVRLRMGGREIAGTAAADGAWRVVLPAMPASAEAMTLEIVSGEERKVLDNILVGEVWICAGQSNMEYPLSSAVGGKEELKSVAAFPRIRMCNLSGVSTANRPFSDAERGRMTSGAYFQGGWVVPDERSAASFSAVGWWAGKTIHETKDVPVGLIDVSVGGSGAEAWLPREVLEAREEYAPLLGDDWLESPRIGAWARGRAKTNLGGKPGAHPYQPGFLYDAGVRWWSGFPITGVLWYQGETNAEIHDDAWNERLITDLVFGWRKVLQQPDLPFFMVQLPRIGGNDPLRQWWPEFREVQSRAAAKLDGVTLIETQDLGWDGPNVHPPDKRPVGERLGKAAARR